MTKEPEDFMTEEFMNETKEALKAVGLEGKDEDFIEQMLVEMIMEIRKSNDLD